MKKVELTDVEIGHIEKALKKVYKDEWCVCCESIAQKLGFVGLNQDATVIRMTQDELTKGRQ